MANKGAETNKVYNSTRQAVKKPIVKEQTENTPTLGLLNKNISKAINVTAQK